MHTVLGKLALVLVLIGAINWGLVGAFDFNLVNYVNNKSLASEKAERAVYILVGLAALWVVYCKWIKTPDSYQGE
jgi:uncharacterized membrane protein YuzA (DUF378 family)